MYLSLKICKLKQFQKIKTDLISHCKIWCIYPKHKFQFFLFFPLSKKWPGIQFMKRREACTVKFLSDIKALPSCVLMLIRYFVTCRPVTHDWRWPWDSWPDQTTHHLLANWVPAFFWSGSPLIAYCTWRNK